MTDIPSNVVRLRHIISSSIHLSNHYVLLTGQLSVHNSNLLHQLVNKHAGYNKCLTYFSVTYKL